MDGVPAFTDTITYFEGFDVIPLDNDCDTGARCLSGGAIDGTKETSTTRV